MLRLCVSSSRAYRIFYFNNVVYIVDNGNFRNFQFMRHWSKNLFAKTLCSIKQISEPAHHQGILNKKSETIISNFVPILQCKMIIVARSVSIDFHIYHPTYIDILRDTLNKEVGVLKKF